MDFKIKPPSPRPLPTPEFNVGNFLWKDTLGIGLNKSNPSMPSRWVIQHWHLGVTGVTLDAYLSRGFDFKVHLPTRTLFQHGCPQCCSHVARASCFVLCSSLSFSGPGSHVRCGLQTRQRGRGGDNAEAPRRGHGRPEDWGSPQSLFRYSVGAYVQHTHIKKKPIPKGRPQVITPTLFKKMEKEYQKLLKKSQPHEVTIAMFKERMGLTCSGKTVSRAFWQRGIHFKPLHEKSQCWRRATRRSGWHGRFTFILTLTFSKRLSSSPFAFGAHPFSLGFPIC